MPLDERLRELLDDSNTIKHCCGQSDTNDIEADIAQIKQAFANEGYAQASHIVMDNQQLERLTGKMTGQEWYDRFKKEAYSCSHYIRSLFAPHVETATKADEREMFVKQDILAASKRAAGLEK